MLTGNRREDDFSESSGDFSSEIRTDSHTRPKRNQNTRRAIKEIRTSGKELQDMGNYEPKVADIDSLSCNNNVTAKHQIRGRQQNASRNQIQLGDYCLPPDKKEETLSGIKSCKTSEYADPYETKQIVEALRAKEHKGPRFSAPIERSDGFTYDLAKPLDDDTSSKSYKEHFRHTYCEGSTPISGTSVDSGVEDPDDYDHTVTWVTNGKNKMAQVIPNPMLLKPQNNVHEQKEMQYSGLNPNSMSHGDQEQVYAGPYEEPWDSSGSKQKFDNIVSKAKLEYRKTSQSDDYETPVLQAATYEDAWDLKSREKDLETQVQEAHRRMSEGQKNLRYQKPREGYDYKSDEPVNIPKSPEFTSLGSSSKQIRRGKPENLVYSDAYEEPWDIKQIEREKALEKQFTNVVHSPKSPKDHDMPNFPAPPPPKLQTYEETWDRNQFISQRSPHNSGNSPNQRRQLDGPRPSRVDVAERINPDIPLDIQQFYHGKIPRKDAEELLLIHKEGSYLVRRSETQANVFSMSLKGIGGMPMHLRISLENGMYILGENSKPFPTVPEMIDHYTRCELPVLKADRIKLLHPIPRHN